MEELGTTPGGHLLVLAILLPVAGTILSLTPGGRTAERTALYSSPFGCALACAIAFHVSRAGKPIVYALGGLPPPLGIALRADGMSAVMLVAAAAIPTAAIFYARGKFATPDGVRESRSSLIFWMMLQAIWAALTIIFLSGDLFNLYVALELLTFAAVPLVLRRWPPRDDRRRVALSPLRAVRIDFLPARRRLALRHVWDTGHFASRTASAGNARCLDGSGSDDLRPARQDSSLSDAPLATARPRQRAGGSQCSTLRPRCQRLILSHALTLVLCPSRPSSGQDSHRPRLSRLCGDYRRQHQLLCNRRD